MTHSSDIARMRQEKDQFFKSHPQSPLGPEQQQAFVNLRYYDYNPDLDLTLKPEIFSEKKNIQLQTSTGDIRYYLRWGKVKFSVDGESAELTLYLMPGSDQFFVPFMDATTNTETYSAGRYLEASRLPNGQIHIDFNTAYSPYCAYNEPLAIAVAAGREPRLWSCPIPPAENRLKVAIRAGEKKPEGAWVEEIH